MAKKPTKVQQEAADTAPTKAEAFDPKPVNKNLRSAQLTMGKKKD